MTGRLYTSRIAFRPGNEMRKSHFKLVSSPFPNLVSAEIYFFSTGITAIAIDSV